MTHHKGLEDFGSLDRKSSVEDIHQILFCHLDSMYWFNEETIQSNCK